MSEVRITKSDIHAPVIDLVLGAFNVNDFIKKFARLSYNIHKNGTAEAIEEADFIESLWGPCCAGMITKEQFVDMVGSRVNFVKTDSYSFTYTVAEAIHE